MIYNEKVVMYIVPQLFERIDVHTGRQAVIWAVRNRPEWFASTLLRVIPDSRRGALEL